MNQTIEIRKFCEAMETWAKACTTELSTDTGHTIQWRREFRTHWEFIQLAIYKSCLLDRLIYGGETLRTEICPEHQGVWCGIPIRDHKPVICPHGCNHGIELTGWIQNTTDPKSEDSGIMLVNTGVCIK